MKISKDWLKELVDLRISEDELLKLLPLKSISLKEITKDYFELDMKGYNRADLLSLRGVALEVAAVTGSKIKFNDIDIDRDKIKLELKNVHELSVKIEEDELCPIYCLVKITDLRVGPSPKEWVKKLNDSGVRSINNIADITNLIMLEFGQPMHAFDAKTVSEEKIIVRRAKKDEKIKTLDGKERKLVEDDLLITDPEKPLGIAGVMGGENSEVTSLTTTILLEAAIFDPISIRKTSTRLGLQSEASKRFVHGLTKERLFQALDTAIKMYQSLGGKLTGLTIVGDYQDRTPKITLTLERLNSLIGVEIDSNQVEEFLTKLNFIFKREGNIWEVMPPYYRLDIEIEEDLIEEVARMYGYEKIPAKKLEGDIPEKIDQALFDLIEKLKNALVNLGLTEVQTYSFYSTSVLNNFSWDKEKLFKVANPISAETEYLREDIWPNLVEVVNKNLRAGLPAGRQGFEDIAVFEIGKTYHPRDKPSEEYRLSIALMNGSDNPILELYQIFQSLCVHLEGVKLNLDLKKGGYEEKYFHPNRFAFLEKDGKKIGGLAEVHPKHLDKFGISKRVAVLDIDISP